MPRTAVVLSPRYLSRVRALGIVGGSERSRAVGLVVQALARADALPGPGDTRAMLPPVSEAWVRRVPGRNLWLWYRFTPETLYLVHLASGPPTPLDE